MHILKQDLLDVTNGIIGHQVNCMGVMGAGLAKAIRQRWPGVYQSYRAYDWTLGNCQVVRIPDTNLAVANLYGQQGYGIGQRFTVYPALYRALFTLAGYADVRREQVYLPFGLGCGLAGGDWSVVRDLIEKAIPQAIVCRRE